MHVDRVHNAKRRYLKLHNLLDLVIDTEKGREQLSVESTVNLLVSHMCALLPLVHPDWHICQHGYMVVKA